VGSSRGGGYLGVAGAMFELPARGRVVVSNSEFRVLGERLARLAVESTPVVSEGARLVGEWIEAVRQTRFGM